MVALSALTIRPMTPADIPEVARVHRAAWCDAYRAQFPPEKLAAFSQQEFEQRWTRAFDTPSRKFCCVVEGEILGVLSVMLDDDRRGAEILALYIAPEWQGQRCGSALMRHALSVFGSEKIAQARLWVVDDNAPAIAFYRRWGFESDGEEKVVEQYGHPLRQIRMTQKLNI